MFKQSSRVNIPIFLYAAILHMVWGVLLLVMEISPNVTPLFAMTQFFGGVTQTGLLLILASILALIKVSSPNLNVTLAAILLIPQMLLLILSGNSILIASFLGQYADGIIRPGLFIFTDQFPVVLLTFMHSVEYVRKFILNDRL